MAVPEYLKQHKTNTKLNLVYNQSIYKTVWSHCPHLQQSSVKGASVYKEIAKKISIAKQQL